MRGIGAMGTFRQYGPEGVGKKGGTYIAEKWLTTTRRARISRANLPTSAGVECPLLCAFFPTSALRSSSLFRRSSVLQSPFADFCSWPTSFPVSFSHCSSRLGSIPLIRTFRPLSPRWMSSGIAPFVHSCTRRLVSSHICFMTSFFVPPLQSPKMAILRGGIEEGLGGYRTSPEGRVYGSGGGREVRCERRERGCRTGGSCLASAAALDCSRGISVVVSSGSLGVGSLRTYPSEGTEVSLSTMTQEATGAPTSMLYWACSYCPTLASLSVALARNVRPNSIFIGDDVPPDSLVEMQRLCVARGRSDRLPGRQKLMHCEHPGQRDSSKFQGHSYQLSETFCAVKMDVRLFISER